MRSFDTFDEALEAGYRPVVYSECDDVSAANTYGYTYKNRASQQKTVTVWFNKEKNQMKTDGCFMPMFPPQ